MFIIISGGFNELSEIQFVDGGDLSCSFSVGAGRLHVDEDICVLEEARLFLATLCNNVVNDILTGSGGIFVVLPVRLPFTPGVSC
jgi:hypothetical protein